MGLKEQGLRKVIVVAVVYFVCSLLEVLEVQPVCCPCSFNRLETSILNSVWRFDGMSNAVVGVLLELHLLERYN